MLLNRGNIAKIFEFVFKACVSYILHKNKYFAKWQKKHLSKQQCAFIMKTSNKINIGGNYNEEKITYCSVVYNYDFDSLPWCVCCLQQEKQPTGSDVYGVGFIPSFAYYVEPASIKNNRWHVC